MIVRPVLYLPRWTQAAHDGVELRMTHFEPTQADFWFDPICPCPRTGSGAMIRASSVIASLTAYYTGYPISHQL